MTSKDESSAVFYVPVPAHPENQNYVVLPVYHRHYSPPFRRWSLRRCLGATAAFLLLAAAVFLLFPSDPELTVVRLNVNRIQAQTSPHLSLDLSLNLTLRVRNCDFFSLDYSSIVVSIGYRGRELGFVTSNGGHVKARGSSYVDATLVLDGFEVIHDVFYLIEDLARGSIPFDTNSEVKGAVRVLFVKVPIKTRISCEVYVNTSNQTVIRQDCYAE